MKIRNWIAIGSLLAILSACAPQAAAPTEAPAAETPDIPTQPLPTKTSLLPTQTPTIAAAASPTAEPTPCLECVLKLWGGSTGIAFTSNRGEGYNHIYSLSFITKELVPLTQGGDSFFSGPFSPDGSQMLVTGFGLIHSYVGKMNPDGSGLVDLTRQPDSDEAFPSWSPDGAKIVFTSRRDGNNELYIMNADGSSLVRLTNSPADEFAPAWSPDGGQIAFVSDRDNSPGVNNLYVMNADGTGIKRLTFSGQNDYSPAWSPDGTKIAFRSHLDETPADIYVIDVDGSNILTISRITPQKIGRQPGRLTARRSPSNPTGMETGKST